jgi:hypothetical protein
MTKVLSLKSANFLVTDELCSNLIDKILVSFKELIHKPKELENDENQMQTATQAVQENTNPGFLVHSFSNLKKSQAFNYFHVSKLLEILIGFASGCQPNPCETASDHLARILFKKDQLLKKQFSEANLVYESKFK